MTKTAAFLAAVISLMGPAGTIALAQDSKAPEASQSTDDSGPVGVSGMGRLAANPANATLPEGVSGTSSTMTEPAVDTAAVEQVDGIWMNADGVPTYKISEDGTVDWATFSGFRRYHAECHVCHGPDGEGSSYAPALKKSAMTLDYYEFLEVVASGREVVGAASNNVMPMFGTNRNVMCYLDDIYVYLRARGTDAIPRGRPAKKERKTEEVAAKEASCME